VVNKINILCYIHFFGVAVYGKAFDLHSYAISHDGISLIRPRWHWV